MIASAIYYAAALTAAVMPRHDYARPYAPTPSAIRDAPRDALLRYAIAATLSAAMPTLPMSMRRRRRYCRRPPLPPIFSPPPPTPRMR